MRHITQLFLLPIVFALAAASACGDDPVAPSPPGGPTASELKRVPEFVEVLGCTLQMDTFLWRDFMPVSPPDGKPLISLVWITDINQGDLPDGIELNYIWVVNGSLVWGSRFSDEERPPDPPEKIEGIARNGPKWGPGIRVDVVVEFQDGEGVRRYLRAAEQLIHRTD